MSNASIALLVPYYGSWPEYLDLYLQSASLNPILEIFFFSDLAPPRLQPDNVHFHYLSFVDLRRLFSAKLGYDCAIQAPYKLCDFKPAYGHIFSDTIRNYSYWAFGDIDILYGNIAECLPPNWRDHDLLTFREEWISGALTILKNSFPLNNLFRHSKSIPYVFTNPAHLGFDECFGLYSFLAGNTADAILLRDHRESFSWLVRTASQLGHVKVFQKTLIKESIARGHYLSYSHAGIIDSCSNRFLLYHYITEKKSPLFAFPCWSHIPSSFFVDMYGFRRSLEAPKYRNLLRVLSCYARSISVRSHRLYRKLSSLSFRFFSRS